MPAIRHLKVVGPGNVKRTVALPLRKPNAAYRSREPILLRLSLHGGRLRVLNLDPMQRPPRAIGRAF